ncbi:TIGR01244 family sulfur transferase [Brucella sp. IR073]|uniref:TIGR01244 family sulfur transferase n=1 Tax=unclassified Brucella TaxID=2632610 RepID=UPI003B97E45F
MDIREIDDTFSVTGQIYPDDVRDIAAAGFRTLICNRPDDESPDQPAFAEIASVAEKAGIPVHYIPVVPGGLTQDDVDAMAAALAEAEGPVLAYCRSGARSTNIYGLARQQMGR